MTGETVVDESAQKLENNDLIKFVAIGFKKDGTLDTAVSDNPDNPVSIPDLLTFQRFFNDKIETLIRGDNTHILNAIKQLSDSVTHMIGKIDILEMKVNSITK